MIRAGRMHRWRELMPEVEQMPKRQRTSELEVTELEVLCPEGVTAGEILVIADGDGEEHEVSRIRLCPAHV